MSSTEQFDVVDIIRAKRDGGQWTEPQIAWVVDAYTRGVVGEEQMAALAMAIFLRGMNRREIAQWTRAMIASGSTLDLRTLSKRTVDKHSTGGVGDKVTLPLGPLVASFGVAVPQLSGRGLGHTGGTLDKLESISGWSPEMSTGRMREILEDVGAVVAAANGDLAPADRKLYALRDVTATVDCIPLIASSIMSKKIAEGTSGLVLDVKVGSGAFMRDVDSARELARTMVDLGADAGVATRALLTDMEVPLGRTIGNALEVREAVEVLSGGGPADVRELTCALARAMLELADVPDADVESALDSGRAMDTWRRMVTAQGGDPDAPLPTARHTHEVRAEGTGFVDKLDALALGVGSWRLGAGRARKEDAVQAGAGIELHVDYGQRVAPGQPIATLHTDTPERLERALESITPGIHIGERPPAPRTLVHDVIS
ncbi:thymidine phosphorylase [Corynebacterium sp. 21KM1197]|uniref:thymidine phosphorylase n=1 Tax=Corynebacterium sp. 21KM1197 TaxID=2989734 RepID=UPI0029C9DED9|nr:thymidine phosphorylase [Corynebacterium sp. 21KM1197]WPF67847.1 thymidine phosphorylase [Corynebacterium sp. 21KM1197]